MLLTIPIASRAVPGIIEFSPAGEPHLRLALAMSRLGMISEADLAPLRRSSMNIGTLRALIENGWRRAVGDDYEFQVLSAHARLILPSPQDSYDFQTEDGTQMVGVAINSAQPEWIAIGKAFSAIEACHPGLGRKALSILESALSHFGLPHTVGGAFEMAQMLYWQGENDETAALAEYGDEADDVDFPRRAELFGNIPEWAYTPLWRSSRNRKGLLSERTFAVAAKRLAAQPVGSLLAALDNLRKAETASGQFAPPYIDQENSCIPNEPPVVCGWNETDDFNRVFDDNYNYFAEGGEEPPWIGCVMFQPTEEGISAAMTSIRHTGRVLRALDVALQEARKLNDEL